eukprot:TRINITY_DN880_c4_g1_i1.p1 TRINITY_DN880_c4_g1~~TRINITY_DN880_c4_g1_i1.p1  ORF type:complete len:142 (+),score=4.17 TRINITY_DN880_c4_g1_i1:76-501(+)
MKWRQFCFREQYTKRKSNNAKTGGGGGEGGKRKKSKLRALFYFLKKIFFLYISLIEGVDETIAQPTYGSFSPLSLSCEIQKHRKLKKATRDSSFPACGQKEREKEEEGGKKKCIRDFYFQGSKTTRFKTLNVPTLYLLVFY